MEHRGPKAGDVLHEGRLKVKRRGVRCLGCSGVRVFRCSGVQVFGCSGVRVKGFRVCPRFLKLGFGEIGF